MFRKILPLFIFIVMANNVFGQTVFSKYAGEFMAIGVGGRPLGMGGAYAAIANDVTSGYYNPAGLARLNYPQAAYMHDERFGNLINYDYAAVALPFKEDMTFALSVVRLGIDGIPDTREALINARVNEVIYDINHEAARIDPARVKEFSNQDWAFYLSFAKKHSENFYYGANVKIITRSIAEYNALGIGFDVGAIYMPTENLSLGANLQDITTTLISWETGRNELVTPTAKIGAGYTVDLGSWGKFTPIVDFDVRFENRKFASNFNLGPVSFDMHAGAEYNYNNLFAIRGGYNDVKQFTVGAGVKLPKLNIDYSFAKFTTSDFDEINMDTHRISIMLTLEEPRFMRKIREGN